MRPRLKTPSARFKFLIIPTLLGFSALAFSLLIESALARHLLALLIFIGLALFFESVITYIWRHDAYVGYSLENLSSYALTLTMFLISCVLAGFYILLDLNLGLIVGLGLLAFLAINYEFFWMSKILSLPTLLFAGTLTLILTQIFVALILLPFHFMIDGAIITVLWYTAASISRAHLLGTLFALRFKAPRASLTSPTGQMFRREAAQEESLQLQITTALQNRVLLFKPKENTKLVAPKEAVALGLALTADGLLVSTSSLRATAGLVAISYEGLPFPVEFAKDIKGNKMSISDSLIFLKAKDEGTKPKQI